MPVTVVFIEFIKMTVSTNMQTREIRMPINENPVLLLIWVFYARLGNVTVTSKLWSKRKANASLLAVCKRMVPFPDSIFCEVKDQGDGVSEASRHGRIVR